MSVFLLSFLGSLIITMLVIRYQRLHGWFSADSDLAGVQKFHDRPVPRIGGLGIFIAVMLGMTWRLFDCLKTPQWAASAWCC
jgi:UDP-N-acetylmuramyl pentapeptide phosphotransferase/UDP-N-acetylglucosamine-1-phosphate transferase